MQQGYEDARTLHQFFEQARWQPTEIESIPADLAEVKLDRGELESIALIMMVGGLLLMDEERGRAEARRRNIPTKGTLGILIDAYHSDLITADQLRFYFDQISERSDIWISPALCQRLLSEVLPL
jgi:predicted nucleic acid-binding protein